VVELVVGGVGGDDAEAELQGEEDDAGGFKPYPETPKEVSVGRFYKFVKFLSKT
jgi:hypothetical protein